MATHIDPTGEFIGRIALAKRLLSEGRGDGWVETTKEMVDYYNPNGLGTAKYFIYNGIKVCEQGLKDTCIEEMELSAHERAHGTKDGSVEQGK